MEALSSKDCQDKADSKTFSRIRFVRAAYSCRMWESESYAEMAPNDLKEIHKLQPSLEALDFVKGDRMEVLGAYDIASNSELLPVKHLTSGRSGYIPRVHVVIDYEVHPNETRGQGQIVEEVDSCNKSITTLNHLLLELLDLILLRSYMCWAFSGHPKLNRPSDEHIITTLASVDNCWFQRITRPAFKKRMRLQIHGFFNLHCSAVITNNEDYLRETIQPSDDFIEKLRSFGCLSAEESISILNEKCRNTKLLYLMRSCDVKKYSAFEKCLRQTNQTSVARLLETGGVTVRAKPEFRKATERQLNLQTPELFKIPSPLDLEIVATARDAIWIWCQSEKAPQVLQEMNESPENLPYFVSSFSSESINPTCVRIPSNQFKKEAVIVRAELEFGEETERPVNLQTPELFKFSSIFDLEVIGISGDMVWIWCKSEKALQGLQQMNESPDELPDIFNRLSSGNINPTSVRIPSIQFKRKAVVCRKNEISFTKRLDSEGEFVRGVTKLRNAIHVLCRTHTDSPSDRNSIRVFEDRNPFRLLRKIKLEEIKEPRDIGSSEKENCLYVTDAMNETETEVGKGCVWKISVETDHQVTRWLTGMIGEPYTLSVSRDGHLLMFRWCDQLPHRLLIYGPDAVLHISLQLPQNIRKPRHAVETSSGNFIILHLWRAILFCWKYGPPDRWVVSEFSRDGETVSRNFFEKDKTQELNAPSYLSLDSVDDRVFVGDSGNRRVIELNSDLTWKRILIDLRKTTEEEEKGKEEEKYFRFCYDEEKKQLIVGGIGGVNVYTFNCK